MASREEQNHTTMGNKNKNINTLIDFSIVVAP
jgi:hypothetical protein